MYQARIKEELWRRGHGDIDPRHIEAYMRLEYGTLDHLTAEKFRHEIGVCIACVLQDGVINAESLARSFGLNPKKRGL